MARDGYKKKQLNFGCLFVCLFVCYSVFILATCLQAVFIRLGPVCSLLGDIPPFFMLLTFISCFMIDFLSIIKMLKFSPRSLPMIVFPGLDG